MSIFVGNLPFRAEQEDVVELFAPFGGVANCSLPLERDTGRKRGFAFVELADEATEARAIEALQGAELMGRPLRINKAEPRSAGGPRRSGGGGYGAGGGGGYGGGGGGYAGAGGSGGGGRSSGASSWEDRSYGGASDAFGEGRSRRRRSSGDTTAGGSSWGASDGGSDTYGGAQD
ncbi:RNA-binding protein [Vulcanococcus limneticus Candia 3F8]|uniref:RNA recognition motif domain-containing protein n=1 Tax=Vulcanococcus limneticus TaxID=2170428 RepID=UPI000B9912C5|nr:RNA-binding protein [Vulcanococcus limneticus]MCP9791669.1 RNA-binding protein [Vulcanococcus limneticus MW73D5]MCP9894591.1 RNA-binding protein [Vulcanococcus limneticus Candia 3F8]MCP9897048.1 RNA-binding protein [Vulcanococcus limneticus Candia 3B3]